MSDGPMILVMGATGTVGGHVVRRLVEGGRRVRVMTRDPARAGKFGGAVEVVQADLERPETLAAAFAGIDKAFVLSNGPAIAVEGNAFGAAKAAGVEQIVRVSAQELDYPEVASSPLGAWHLRSDQRLRESGIPWTILKPSYFASNTLIPFFFDRQHGGALLPAGDGKESPIDHRDIAEAAVAVLTTSGHVGRDYVLTGPELLSHGEMMEKVSVVIGERMRHTDVSEAEGRERMLAAGFPPPFADSLLGHFAAIRAGRAYLTTAAAELLGRAPHTFDEWVRDHAAALRA